MISFRLDRDYKQFSVHETRRDDNADPFSLIDLNNEPQEAVDHINAAVSEIFKAREILARRNETVRFNLKRIHNQSWEMSPENVIAFLVALSFNYFTHYGYGKSVDVRCDFDTRAQMYPALWWFLESVFNSITDDMKPDWMKKILALPYMYHFYDPETDIELKILSLALNLMGARHDLEERSGDDDLGSIMVPKEVVW